METLLRYAGHSATRLQENRSELYLAPDLNRSPVYLKARIVELLPFRDAMLALRDCIVSELYLSAQQIADRQNDPVITVAPDRVYFEAFSRDESSYARLSLKPGALSEITALQPGCTNIDFSDKLRQGLQQMRSSRPAWLEVGLQGLAIQVDQQQLRETRIQLPDSWVQGFLEVQSALRLPAVQVEVHPQELRNLLVYLKQRKEKSSPRSLRFRLIPGEGPEVTVEPWNQVFRWQRSGHTAQTPVEIRLWGRRRLLLLEKLLPHLKHLRLFLLGTGLPSFWLADLGQVSFLLGLSAWTARDWTRAEQYHLFQPQARISPDQSSELLAFLQATPACRQTEMALGLGWSDAQIRAGLHQLSLQGQLLFDPETLAYYPRELFVGAVPSPASLSKREQEASRLVAQGKVQLTSEPLPEQPFQGQVYGRGGVYQLSATLAADGSLSGGCCECRFFARHSLQRGPCKHLLALQQVALDALQTKNSAPGL